MSALVWLVPIALLMGLAGLGAFFWSLKNGQYEDTSGAAERILLNDDDRPLVSRTKVSKQRPGSRPTRRERP
jgi:cbb3-type cytochrome oxidase maturation protein